MRIDLIVKNPEDANTIAFISHKILRERRGSRYRDTNYHTLFVEASSVEEAGKYCSFIATLRRQLVPGMEFKIAEVKQIIDAEEDRYFYAITLGIAYGVPPKTSSVEFLSGVTRYVDIGELEIGGMILGEGSLFSSIENLTFERYVLSKDFYDRLESTSTPLHRRLFGQSLFLASLGQFMDLRLSEQLDGNGFLNMTPGNVTAEAYFQEIVQLGRTTGRKLAGYAWDFTDPNELTLTWFYQPDPQPRFGPNDVFKDGYNKCVYTPIANPDVVRPFTVSMIDRFFDQLEHLALTKHESYAIVIKKLADTAKEFTKLLKAEMAPVASPLDWKALAGLKPVEPFRMPVLTAVYEKYKHVMLLLTNDHEAQIGQVQALYSSDTTDLMVFVTERLNVNKRRVFEYIFEHILPSPSVERKKKRKDYIDVRPFMGHPSRKATLVSVFGEGFYHFQKEFGKLSNAGVYANETFFIDVEGFVNKEKADMTLVCVGVMKKVETAGENEDIVRTRYEK